jgi:butyrate kinase
MDGFILIINTGNTSTKVGLYENGRLAVVESIKHSDEDLAEFDHINSQMHFRENVVLDFLASHEVPVERIEAVAARGGLLRPVESGTYTVNDRMLQDLREGKRGMHASHLSAQIGSEIARRAGCSCYVVDPISVDEFEPIARYSGHKLFERVMLTHALNMKAVVRRFARDQQVDHRELTLIVVHLGTGISVAAHRNGRMIDAVNPREEGPFSPDRSGGLPVLQAVRYVLEEGVDFETFSRMVFGNGGLYSYLGTKDFQKVEALYRSGDPDAVAVVQAMAYQVAKEVGAMATTTSGDLDAVLITGGMARAGFFVEMIRERISFLAPVKLYPGEDEIEALAEGVYRVIQEEEEAKTY